MRETFIMLQQIFSHTAFRKANLRKSLRSAREGKFWICFVWIKLGSYSKTLWCGWANRRRFDFRMRVTAPTSPGAKEGTRQAHKNVMHLLLENTV